jgi:hypothetical protein
MDIIWAGTGPLTARYIMDHDDGQPRPRAQGFPHTYREHENNEKKGW